MPTPEELANLRCLAMAEWSSSDKTLCAGNARRVSAGSADQFQQFVTPDGRKFTKLYNGAGGDGATWTLDPQGSGAGGRVINREHLATNKLDGVCRVTICTLQRLYALLRSLFSSLNKHNHGANGCAETGNASREFNEACVQSSNTLPPVLPTQTISQTAP